MKAEHRKELETNTLADRIGTFVTSFREGPSRNAIVYGSVVVAILLLVVVYRWVASSSEASDSTRWLLTDETTTRQGLEKMANDFPDTEQGRLARFGLARLDFNDGLKDLNSIDASKAVDSLRRAAATYEKLAGESGNTPLLAQEALLNGGKARESLGEFEKAKDLYARLARDYPQSIKGKQAAEQVKIVETPGPELEQLKKLAQKSSPDSTTVQPLPAP